MRGRRRDQPACGGRGEAQPADALVYLHLSTDTDRDAVEEALDLAERFPAFPRLQRRGRRAPLHRDRHVSFQRDVRPWLGDEAALAFWNTRSQTAGSLVVLDVADRKKVDAFLSWVAGTPNRTEYRGADVLSATETPSRPSSTISW